MENVTPREEELETYTWMKPFLAGRNSFRGIRHDLDTGHYSFAFGTMYKDPSRFFEQVDSNVAGEGWELIQGEQAKRVYQRPGTAPWDDFVQRVTLGYETETSEILFVSEAQYTEDK